MSEGDKAAEIEQRRARAGLQGGAEAIAKQHGRGRLTIRERIDRVLDASSFREVGPIAGKSEVAADGSTSFTPGNFVVGFGRIGGRNCVVAGEDFTQAAGSPNAAGLRKSVYTEELAIQYRVPLVRFHEGSGGSVGGSDKAGPSLPEALHGRHRFLSVAQALATVPVVSAAVGTVAGLPAGRLVSSHYTVMTRTSQVIIGGPALVERALGMKVSKEDLGGPTIHEKSGVVDDVVEDEAAAFDAVRTFLSYLPQNVWELPPRRATDDPPGRMDAALDGIVPANRRRVYDIRAVVRSVLDQGSFFEMGRRFGPGQVVGLARLAGYPVGIFANDVRHFGGAITADGAQKLRRFVEFCQTFHLPVISFVDEPGFMIGPEAERAATMRYGAMALATVALATVPWATVRVRKSMGLASYAHVAPGAFVLAWPTVEMGALPLEGGVAVAFKHEIAQAEDPAAKRAELEAELAARQSPFRQADGFAVHDLIHPRETRPRLADWIELVQPLLTAQLGPSSFSYRP
ncbi:acyl-CoA carboxylase subunit beta [Chelatococcus reniformis]|uniref:acyl-CoA carboxylase subunit beta n=1 Tax=Chelatococcus reniformis TaxID=1494448 RepID=UPI00166388C5|nr:carboxyl transferase domain-containing protein [Chelatococcus reniformis]